MISSPRDDRALFTPPAASVTLHKTPLWTQDITILDVTWIEGSPPHLIVLDVDKIAAYRFQDGRWQTEESWPITHANLWPRDARGKLVLGPDNLIDAYLPGLYCHTTSGKTQTLTCKATDDPWPLGPEQNGLDAFFAATRNYFTGVLAPGIAKQKATAPFYTAAIIPHQTYNLGLFAGVDGQIHVLDGSTDRNAGNWGWGSSVAGVHTDCGSGWQVLANRGSSDVKDTLTAYDLPDREPVAVSQALEFGGPVTEIWTKSGSSSAVAVVHNRETGQYEAFRLTVTCNQ
jgi:hypothetical protein